MEQHYTTRQAAELVGETPRGIAEKCSSGVIRAKRPHLPDGRRGQWRIPESSLRRYLGEELPVVKHDDMIEPEMAELLARKDYKAIRVRIQENAKRLYPEKYRRAQVANKKRGNQSMKSRQTSQ